MSKSLFGITEGILCQQCNCKGKYGAGISGAISSVYPEVYSAFKKDYETYGSDRLFGRYGLVKCNSVPPLYVANIYSQYNYGRQGIHTDIDKLADAISTIAIGFYEYKIYLPYHVTNTGKVTGIGAGLGGANWDDIEKCIQYKVDRFNIRNIYLYDTINQKVERQLIPIKRKV